jgi:hypothetical protein
MDAAAPDRVVGDAIEVARRRRATVQGKPPHPTTEGENK